MKSLKNVFSAVGSLLMIGLFVVAVAPVQAGEVTDRIKALEQELTQLKGGQVEMREEAKAARAKLPSFKYRGGSGLTITAGNKSWAIKFGGRLQPYMGFWLDRNSTKNNTPQGVLRIRRFRPYTNWKLQNGFYELKQQNDGESTVAFDAEMFIHFEKLNPWLPYVGWGATPSLTINPQSHNLSSKRAGRSEQPFLENATGLTTGSANRGIVAVWKKLPRLGQSRITFFNVGYGMDRTDNGFGTNSGEGFDNDGKSFTLGAGVKPFDGTKNKWLKGLELSFGTVLQKAPQDDFKGWTVEADQLKAQEIEFIKVDGGTGMFKYYTPGIGWKAGPFAIHYTHNFARMKDHNTAKSKNEGVTVKGNGFRILVELFLWNPKTGAFTGSTSKGGLMIAPMFQRASVKAGEASGVLSNCNGCKSAHAYNSGLGLWYFIPGKFMNLGVVWDHWGVTNMNSDMSSRIYDKSSKEGKDGSFNTLTFVTRFHW